MWTKEVPCCPGFYLIRDEDGGPTLYVFTYKDNGSDLICGPIGSKHRFDVDALPLSAEFFFVSFLNENRIHLNILAAAAIDSNTSLSELIESFLTKEDLEEGVDVRISILGKLYKEDSRLYIIPDNISCVRQ